MKKILIYLAIICPMFAAAQDGKFTVKGTVGTLNAPAQAYLLYQLGANRLLDSSAIVNGHFSISGDVLFPVQATVVIDTKGVGIAKLDTSADHLVFYIEKGEINLNSADKIANAQITGSKVNDDNKKLNAQMNAIDSKARIIAAEAAKTTPAVRNSVEYQNQMQARYKVLQNEAEAELKSFIKNNPDSFLSLLAIGSLGRNPNASAADLDALYTLLSPSVKDTEPGKSMKDAIDKLKSSISVGTLAPDFTQTDVNGAPVKLSSFRGKYVLVDFWASWCGPCRQENPNVVRAYNKYKTKNFTILGVSLDKDKAAWVGAIKSDGLAWTQVSDLQSWQNAVATQYNVTSIPQNYLIDPPGKIIGKNLRGQDLDDKLEELFGKI